MSVREVCIDVDGTPPAKSEARSMFAANHPHSIRVRALLQAAQAATESLDFDRFTQPIGLEVVLRGPIASDASDATNYLGGIADVLQDKVHLAQHGSLRVEHPSDLMHVALYRNDGQIQEIHFRREGSGLASYSVKVWLLDQDSRE